jgi:hypothetical protein
MIGEGRGRGEDVHFLTLYNLGRRQARTVREVEETPGRARFDIQNPEVNLTRIERAGRVAAGIPAGKEDNGRKLRSI